MKRLSGAFGKCALLCFILFFALAGISHAQTWYPANQRTVAWDAVATDADGNPFPAGAVVLYQIYYKTPASSTPVYIGETNMTSVAISFPAQGSYFVGISAVQKEGALIVAESEISWSDNAAVCAGGQTFGIRFYVRPGNPRNLRVVGN
jgi:hypothetical protein